MHAERLILILLLNLVVKFKVFRQNHKIIRVTSKLTLIEHVRTVVRPQAQNSKKCS